MTAIAAMGSKHRKCAHAKKTRVFEPWCGVVWCGVVWCGVFARQGRGLGVMNGANRGSRSCRHWRRKSRGDDVTGKLGLVWLRRTAWAHCTAGQLLRGDRALGQAFAAMFGVECRAADAVRVCVGQAVWG